MSTAVPQDTYRNLPGPAKQLQSQYLPQIEQKASTIDATRIIALVDRIARLRQSPNHQSPGH